MTRSDSTSGAEPSTSGAEPSTSGAEPSTSGAEPGLLVQLIGAFTVRWRGRVLTPVEVGNRGARRLLALLAIQPGRTVAIDRVVDVLWSAATTTAPRHPAANVASLVSRLRGRLGTGVVCGDRRNGYRLGRQVRVDLQETAVLVQAAEALLANHRPAPALAVARRALTALEEAAVLTDELAADWAEPARRLQDQLLGQARQAAGAAALVAGDTRAAIGVGRAAMATDRFDEAAHRLLMCAYYVSHEPAQALLIYERLRTTLAEELGTDPARATRDLQLVILKNDTLSATAMLAILRPAPLVPALVPAGR